MTVVDETVDHRDDAIRLAELGLAPIRLRPGTKIAADRAWTEATPDAERARTLWAERPSAGIGVVGGTELASGKFLAIVDVDVRPGYDGADTLDDLAADLGPLPDTVTAHTPSGGRHSYFWTSHPLSNAVRSGLVGIDIRGRGGYVVAPPTVTEAGAYLWEIDHGPGEIRLAELPAEWVAALTPDADAPTAPSQTSAPTSTPSVWDAIDAGDTDSPGDRFNAEHDIASLIEADGYRFCSNGADGNRYYTRPGKEVRDGQSVTLFPSGSMFVHSSNCPGLDVGESYSPFGYLAATRFAGDYSAAARSLRPATPTPPANVDRSTGEIIDTAPAKKREVRAVKASSIRPRRVRWLWADRIALGTLALLAGPEGLGKSTLAYDIAARVSKGELPGEHHGHPRSVLVCATEDSWAHTIVPRLMAAGADLDRIYRVDVLVDDTHELPLNLPNDINDVAELAEETAASLLILDPLMSRLDASLDSHRDGEVRLALEPLTAMLDRAGLAAIGLIHHNKSGSTDPLNLVMASKAFTAVARSVHTVIRDPDDESGARKLFGTPKNNLGRLDLPLKSFTIQQFFYAVDGDPVPGSTGQLVWGDDTDGSIGDALTRSVKDGPTGSDATRWLAGYMTENARQLLDLDGERGVDAGEVREAAEQNGYSKSATHRAKERLGIAAEKGRGKFSGRWFWVLPGAESGEDPALSRGDTQVGCSMKEGPSTPGRDEDPEGPTPSALGPTRDLPSAPPLPGTEESS